jgi:1,4-dihydroxy-2-naphthoate octaprenyltransferase
MHIAMLIAFSLPDYATDLKFGKRNLLVRLGWQRAMHIHNILLGAAYLILLLGVRYGLPLSLAWPGFISLPFAAYQVWHMIRISEGAPTRWSLLTFNALVIFGGTAYFLALAFWTG